VEVMQEQLRRLRTQVDVWQAQIADLEAREAAALEDL
jgi:hypothetical protein